MSTTQKKKHALSATPVIAPVVVNPVPVPGAPVPPEGAVLNVKHPGHNQRKLNAAAAAGEEVRAYATYLDFGAAAPSQAVVADALTSLGHWRAEERAAALWIAYARAQLAGAAAHAETVTAPFQAPFEALMAHRPELAMSFRGMSTYFTAKSDAAKKGAANRKLHAKKGISASASVASSTASTGTEPAVVVTASVPVAPGGGTHTSG